MLVHIFFCESELQMCRSNFWFRIDYTFKQWLFGKMLIETNDINFKVTEFINDFLSNKFCHFHVIYIFWVYSEKGKYPTAVSRRAKRLGCDFSPQNVPKSAYFREIPNPYDFKVWKSMKAFPKRRSLSI